MLTDDWREDLRVLRIHVPNLLGILFVVIIFYLIRWWPITLLVVLSGTATVLISLGARLL